MLFVDRLGFSGSDQARRGYSRRDLRQTEIQNLLSISPSNFSLYLGPSAGTHQTGFENTAAGFSALSSNTSGGLNAAVGSFALQNNTTGGENIAVGNFVLNANTTGGTNTAIGNAALLFNTTDNNNTATGANALRGLSSGCCNTATGNNALISSSTGGGNTGIGDGVLFSLATGSNNTALGRLAGANFNGSESNNIDIGNPGTAGESGVIRIGAASNQAATFIAGITGVTTGSATTSTVLVDSNGQLGTIASSRRYKEDIRDMGSASDGLLRLRPVTFRYKKPYTDGSKPTQYGLIAEEVAEVYPDLVIRDKDGQPETVQYYKLDTMLLNEVQKLAKLDAADQAEIAKLQSDIAEQRSCAQEQQAAMEQLRAQIRMIEVALAHGRSADGSEHLARAQAPEETRP